MAKDINIGGRLHSIATGNVVAGTDEILDDNLGKKQTQINTETYSLVESVNNALAELSPNQEEALGVATKANANEAKLGYYVCDTAAATAAKVIANATGYVLSVGGSIKIKMTNNNTADNATLNINSTGAKALYYAGERASSINTWEAGETVEIYYDGTSYYANNVAGGSEGGDTDALINVVEQVLADNNSGSTLSNSYIGSGNSREVASSGMRTWKVTGSRNYTRIVAHVRNNDTGAYSISFFSSSDISVATKIASYVHSATDWDDYDLPIPDGTALICVTTRSTYQAESYFRVYGLVDGMVQQLNERVIDLESAKAIEPFMFDRYINKYGWTNDDRFDSYANFVGDPYKHKLTPYLVDGKLVIINTYTGENQIKCKIPWFTALGEGNSYNAWTVLQQGENVFTPRANSVYFSICLGMNDSEGTEINASDISLYERYLYYKRANTNSQQITENVGFINDIENRLNIMDNFGNPLYVGGVPLVYDKVYFGRPLRLGKRYKRIAYSISTGGNQGGAVYNDLLFTFNGNHSKCFIIEMNTKTIIQTISLTQETNFHCNCVNFGVEKADAADEFPLLYVDGLYTKTCYVYRITGYVGAYVLTKVQTITYPSEWNHPEMFIDHDANTMWVLDDQTNNVTFRRMEIPGLSAGDVTLSANNVLDEVNIGATPVIQSGSIFNGDLYFGVGFSGDGIIYVIDLYAEKRIVTRINYHVEPQTPFVWNRDLYVLNSNSLEILYLT